MLQWKQATDTHGNLVKVDRLEAEWQKLDTEGHMLSDSIYGKVKEGKTNPRWKEPVQWLPLWGGYWLGKDMKHLDLPLSYAFRTCVLSSMKIISQ